MDLNIESSVFHMCVDLLACVPLSELNALTVPLDNLDDEIQDRESATCSIPHMLCLIVISEMKLKLLFQECCSLL